jgi:hypothetical protein
MSQLQASGGQPQKQPKYAPIYTGRFFNGIYTNRSPLRAANASHISEKYYSDNSQDAMISGSNIELSNRLTLIRRPGNPLYDNTHSYNSPGAFDEFRVNKGASDVFGATLEQIFTMVDEDGSGANRLYSLTDAANGFKRGGDSAYNYGLSFPKSSGSGQSYMQSVGNSLYFANGVDNKKWLTSLFVRNSSGNNQFIQGTDGLAGTYPFGTYLVDPATGNLQQFIGVVTGTITAVTVASGLMTLSVTMDTSQAATRDYPTGTYFQLYGFTGGASFLNGATVLTTAKYDSINQFTTLKCRFNHADVSLAGLSGYLIQTGTTGDGVNHASGAADAFVAKTGGTRTYLGYDCTRNYEQLHGQLDEGRKHLWVNRGPAVENWGIKAPTLAPEFSVTGHELAWQKNTYYSPASVYVDVNGNMWQITTPGTTGTVEPTWPGSPRKTQKVIITSVYSDGVNIHFTTDTQSPALVAGDSVRLQNMCAFGGVGSANLPDLEGVTFTVSATGLTTTAFQAPYTTVIASSSFPVIEYGQAVKIGGTLPPTTVTDGGAVWTSIHLAADLTWAAHKHYDVGDFLVANKFLFQLGPKATPWVCTTGNSIAASINLAYLQQPGSHQNSDWQGSFQYYHTGDPNLKHGSYNYTWGADYTPTNIALPSLWLERAGGPGVGGTSEPYAAAAVNGAGEVGGLSNIGPLSSSWVGAITCLIFIPKAGTYTFTFQHNDGGFFAFDSQAVNPWTVISGATGNGTANNVPQSVTAQMGYGRPAGVDLCGTNKSGQTGPGPYNQPSTFPADSAQWTFPQAGAYAIEIDYAKWYHSSGFCVFMTPGSGGVPNQTLAIGKDISGATAPAWTAFTKTGASYDATEQQIVWGGQTVEIQTAGQQYDWNNLGPISDYVWKSGVFYTLPGTTIVDTNSNQEGAYETGITGDTQPAWVSTPNYIIADPSPPLLWLNEGSIPAISNAGNTITATSTQGWLYYIALVNTLDQTVSNLSPVSIATGPVVKGQVTFAPGAGLNLNTIDPQADYVAIFRTTDGFTTPFLIPGFVNSPYTVPLKQYLENGYVDTVPDTQLNNLLQGPLAKQNTPPPSGAINLSYHLQRIWYSIGNTVYWTTGPLSPIGNGTDGFAPGNFADCPSQVKRLVPTAIGMLVFTVSDIFIISGNGTSSNPLNPALPYFTGIGLGNYNALDVNGGLIGFFTTDKQFVIFNPSAGVSYVGFNIGDQFRKNNGRPGTSWSPQTAYVSYYTNGEDVGWFVGDAVNGWYKLIPTPAPEQGGVAWSPFATILSLDSLSATVGVRAIKSIETSPGVHSLLVGQNSSAGYILARDLDASTDGGTSLTNGTKYIASAVIGSIVLASPGQVAKIAYITTESVLTGSPLTIGVLLDDAIPYFQGSFDTIKTWVDDPPGLPVSRSFYAQRFYLSETEEPAYARHLQILIQWPAEAVNNELQTLTIFGAYEVEV